jgi:hypothetical protein
VPLNRPFTRQTDNGEAIVFNEETGILTGTDDPSSTDISLGTAIPVSTLYIRTGTTEIYQKFDTGATDWRLIYSASLNAFVRTAVSANYTILVTDSFIGVDTSTTAITLTLPLGSTVPLGKIITVKDESSNAKRRPVTINTSGSDTIEGGVETSVKIRIDDFSVDIQWTGNEWSIV